MVLRTNHNLSVHMRIILNSIKCEKFIHFLQFCGSMPEVYISRGFQMP
jgi:hypothetical protein